MNIRRLILLAAIVLPLHSTAVLASTTAVGTHDCTVSTGAYRYLTPNVVKQVQNALARLSLYRIPIDGIAGPATREGLARYCQRRGLSVGSTRGSHQALIDELLRDAAIDPWTVSYQLDQKYFTGRADRGKALAKLSQLKNGNQQVKADFVATVKGLLKGNPVAKTMLALALKDADKQTLLTLTPQGLQRLQANGVPESVLNRLGKLEYPGYTSRAAARRAIRTALLKGNHKGVGKGTQSSSSQKKALQRDSAKWARLITSQLNEQVFYRLSSNAWSKMERANSAVPGYVLTMLEGMKNVDYPLRSLFEAAVYNHILHKIPKKINEEKLKQLGPTFYSELKQQGIPTGLINALIPLRGKPYATTKALIDAVKTALSKKIEPYIKPYIGDLVKQARIQHLAPLENRVEWSAAPGSRLLPNTIKDESYGFYPYWLSDASVKVHFGSISRIGYYAVSFNDEGEIHPPGWTSHGGAAFTLARKYETKLDLVVAKRDWTNWDTQKAKDRSEAFSTLAGKIAALLSVQPDDALSRLAYYSRLGFHKPALGNGVTLFFQNYPSPKECPECQTEFTKFIKTLRAKLKPNQAINLMLSCSDLGNGVFSYQHLSDLSNEYGSDKRMMILVLLPEPYIRAEMKLRYDIERHLQTAQKQRNLLRSTVPVIVPDGSGDIENEVIYAGDNFGGIGFWPLPTKTTKIAKITGADIASTVRSAFYPTSSGWADKLCSIVGPNRWLFRLAFYLALLISLSTLTIYLLLCRSRAVINKGFILVLACTVVPLVLLGMSLLGCDPILREISKGNIPLFLVLMSIIVYAIWRYAQHRKKLP